VHCNPAEALCDGDQSLSPVMFASMMKKLTRLDSCMNEIEGDVEN
jgi:3-deoxy-D-arabino-heptulosonate 7-phosphate (DAHP) synthase